MLNTYMRPLRVPLITYYSLLITPYSPHFLRKVPYRFCIRGAAAR